MTGLWCYSFPELLVGKLRSDTSGVKFFEVEFIMGASRVVWANLKFQRWRADTIMWLRYEMAKFRSFEKFISERVGYAYGNLTWNLGNFFNFWKLFETLETFWSFETLETFGHFGNFRALWKPFVSLSEKYYPGDNLQWEKVSSK
jgi:hypothetical protein